MNSVESQVFDLGAMDRLSRQQSIVHQLDPRAKLLVTLAFIVTTVSFGKYDLAQLMPFLLYPIFLIAAGRIPFFYIAKKILLVSPFAIMIGIFNPFLDSHILLTLGPLDISGGWISFFSILLRFVLTVSAALLLLAVTGLNDVCLAMEKLGAPRVFSIQLMFLYRYLFVLTEESLRLIRARSLRSFGKHDGGLRSYGPMVGHLLLRTLDRAQRIHLAMHCRGFTGQINRIQPLHFSLSDALFIAFWCFYFISCRFYNLPDLFGKLIMELFT